MYNDTRYSLARYSVKQQARDIPVEESFAEVLGALAGAAVPVDIREPFAEACHGSIRGTVSMITLFDVREALTAAVRMSADVITRAALVETIQSNALGLKNMPAALAGEDVLTASARAAKDIHTHLELADGLSSLAAGSKDIHMALDFFEVLTLMGRATSQTVERAVFQLTIPPGGELRIDSELFLVLLNGENTLHAQSGAWINISRDLLRLNIESAAGGGLEGDLIYTERYL